MHDRNAQRKVKERIWQKWSKTRRAKDAKDPKDAEDRKDAMNFGEVKPDEHSRGHAGKWRAGKEACRKSGMPANRRTLG